LRLQTRLAGGLLAAGLLIPCLRIASALPRAAEAQPSATAPASASWTATFWRLDGAGDGYVMEGLDGLATDPGGAALSLGLRESGRGRGGKVTSRVAAGPALGRRFTLSAELQTRGVSKGAALWLQVDRGSRRLILDLGSDARVRGDSGWTTRTIDVPVPDDAETIQFGVSLEGGGSVAVRRLRVQAGAPIAADAPIAPDAKALLDAAFAIIRKHALRGATVAWADVEPRVRALAAGAARPADVYPAIQYLLARLDDHHSLFMTPVEWREAQTAGAENLPAGARALPDGVGYVRVPGFWGADRDAMRQYAARAHDAIEQTMTSASCGWIVDLRQDWGGNMFPMLAGLKPFLGGGTLGRFEGPALPSEDKPWVAGDRVGVEPPAALAPLESAWVAVLTGPATGSAGEIVAIAFRGRPRTRSFGQPTYGVPTANYPFELPDGATMMLTTGVSVDRTGRRYGEKVAPDELHPEAVGGADGNATATARATARASARISDPARDAAIAWLRQSSGCR
jgi:hypothetical protein